MSEPIDVLKALSDFGRLRILKMLEIKSLCVCEITEMLGLATSTVSSHLNVLKNADLIQDEKEGKWINYALKKNMDAFSTALWRVISSRIEGDELVVQDFEKIKRIDRYQIGSCSRPK